MTSLAAHFQAETGDPRSPRRRTYIGATIVHGHEMMTVDCVVVDSSDTGVKISVPPMTMLPERFWMLDRRIALAHERGEREAVDQQPRAALGHTVERSARGFACGGVGLRMSPGNQRGGMVVMRRRRVLARIAIARADQRNGAGDDGAEQRQDDNGLVHPASPSSD